MWLGPSADFIGLSSPCQRAQGIALFVEPIRFPYGFARRGLDFRLTTGAPPDTLVVPRTPFSTRFCHFVNSLIFVLVPLYRWAGTIGGIGNELRAKA